MSDSSEIQRFYTNTTILLTGATGFLGKVLLEKLLRACNVKRIYCLIRAKKNKTSEERLDEMLDSPMFENVKKSHPDLQTKIGVVRGNCLMENLNLSANSRQILTQEVEIIFHVAATIKFDQTLKTAMQINVKSTKYLLDLAKDMQRLKAFVYTSTAYSNCDKSIVDEVIYRNPISVNTYLALVDDFDEDFINKITKNVLGKLPNTYVFTKGLTEEFLLDYGKLQCNLPIVIVRPSILSSSYREPLPGWIDSWFTVGSISAAGSYGLLRSANTDATKLADIVPTDYAVNCLIASALAAVNWNSDETTIPIFNFVTSAESPITWGDYTKKCFQMGMHYAPSRCCRYPCVKLTRHKMIHKIRTLYMHHLPAHVCDVLLRCVGSKLRVRFLYKLLHNFLDDTSYFTTREWKFVNANVRNLWTQLSPLDQATFRFSMKDFDWDDYLLVFLKNGRVHLLKDDPSNLPQARRRIRILRVVHYFVVCVECSVVLWIDYLLLCSFNVI